MNMTSATRAPGRACNNYRGYCDQYGLCHGITADNPFAALAAFDFNAWFQKYWPIIVGVVLGLIAAILIMYWTYNKRKTQIDGMFNRWAGKLNQTLFRRGKKTADLKKPNPAQQDNLEKFRKLKQRTFTMLFDCIMTFIHLDSTGDGVKRLRRFFPTVKDEATLEQIISASKTEEEAVIKLLKMGYPLAAL